MHTYTYENCTTTAQHEIYMSFAFMFLFLFFFFCYFFNSIQFFQVPFAKSTMCSILLKCVAQQIKRLVVIGLKFTYEGIQQQAFIKSLLFTYFINDCNSNWNSLCKAFTRKYLHAFCLMDEYINYNFCNPFLDKIQFTKKKELYHIKWTIFVIKYR